MPRAIHPLLTKVACDWLETHAPVAVPASLERLGSTQSAGVDVETHREALEAVYEHGGATAVARLPEMLAAFEGESLVYIMLNSSSVADLVDKEYRLERFWHSHHRIRVHEQTACALELEHFARSGRMPVRAESLFVFGARAMLLREIGCVGLRAYFPRSADPSRTVMQDGRWTDAVPNGELRVFRFEWDSFVPTRKVLEGLDDLLLARAQPADLSEMSPTEEVETIVRQDLAHRWTLAEVSKLSGRSSRSLQRALAGDDETFSAVIDRVRVEAAVRMLADSRYSVTEVGYCCGFSDAAHFSRRFKAAKGVPPSEWRSKSKA